MQIRYVIFAANRNGGPLTLSEIVTLSISQADNILGSHSLIALAPADVNANDYLIVIRESEALKKGWIKKPSVARIVRAGEAFAETPKAREAQVPWKKNPSAHTDSR